MSFINNKMILMFFSGWHGKCEGGSESALVD